jgi:fatty-acyl-CoA synthase
MTAEVMNVATRLSARARDFGDKTALVFGDTSLSFRQLDEMAGRVAAALIAMRLPPQSRIAVLDHNSDRYVQLLFGIARAGHVLVGINSRLAGPEVRYIVEDSGARLLFVGEEHGALIEGIEPALPGDVGLIWLYGEHARWQSFDRWIKDAGTVEANSDEPSDLVQLYTSGTTGYPKGACHTHSGWLTFADSMKTTWGNLGPDNVYLVTAPMFHVAGFNPLVMAIVGGATAVLLRKLDPAGILESIARHHVTDSFLVPAVVALVVRHPLASTLDLSSLKRLSYGAAPMPADLLAEARQRLKCDFVHLYGQTENLGGATWLPPEAHDPVLGKLRSVGRPYPGTELRIVDSNGADVGVGEVGEIVARSPWVMREYWRRADATAETVRDGWLFSGDAGYLDADGYLYLHDRVKDMIISGGENIYPAEVENALFGHPSVADVAVIGVPDEKWGESVKAIVVLKPGYELDAEALTQFARQRIAGYKLPRFFAVIDQLPRNASGKVLRRELRESK